jgi:hypothetical protein
MALGAVHSLPETRRISTPWHLGNVVATRARVLCATGARTYEYVTEAHFATRLSMTTESPDGAHNCRLSPAFEFSLRCTRVESGCSEMKLDAEALVAGFRRC